MRDIKYKAKDTDGKWWWGELKPEGANHINLAVFFANICRGLDYSTLREYTNVRDVDGVGIYACDILTDWNKNVWLVMWAVDGWECLDYKAWSEGFYDAYARLSEIGQVDAGRFNSAVKVIGNTLDTPELVKDFL